MGRRPSGVEEATVWREKKVPEREGYYYEYCCARYRSTCDVQADVGGSTGPCMRETPPSLLQLFTPHVIDAVRAVYIFLVVSVSFFLESCYFSH